MAHKYKLYTKRGHIICPNCHRKTLSPYVDSETLALLAEKCGKCERIFSCGYHLPPREYLKDNAIDTAKFSKTTAPRYDDFNIPQNYYTRTMQRPIHDNPLFLYFLKLFNAETNRTKMNTIKDVFHHYRVGTSKLWEGSTIFWQFDHDESATPVDGKIMKFNPADGKRIKEPRPLVTFVSKVMARKHGKKYNVERKPFFGQHLLDFVFSKIFVVESEKTALALASLAALTHGFDVCREIAFIAVQSCQGLNMHNIKILSDSMFRNAKTVTLLPDRDAVLLWHEKITLFPLSCRSRLDIRHDYTAIGNCVLADNADPLDVVEAMIKQNYDYQNILSHLKIFS